AGRTLDDLPPAAFGRAQAVAGRSGDRSVRTLVVGHAQLPAGVPRTARLGATGRAGGAGAAAPAGVAPDGDVVITAAALGAEEQRGNQDCQRDDAKRVGFHG